MPVRGIRGAIDVQSNSRDAITAATKRLLAELCAANALRPGDIISAFFTQTTDLDAEFPAAAARALGWTDVPLLDAQELEVPGAMPRVVRVLLHVETTLPREAIRHVYLDGAAALRPDLRRTDA
jgi:chorismate mutase